MHMSVNVNNLEQCRTTPSWIKVKEYIYGCGVVQGSKAYLQYLYFTMFVSNLLVFRIRKDTIKHR